MHEAAPAGKDRRPRGVRALRRLGAQGALGAARGNHPTRGRVQTAVRIEPESARTETKEQAFGITSSSAHPPKRPYFLCRDWLQYSVLVRAQFFSAGQFPWSVRTTDIRGLAGTFFGFPSHDVAHRIEIENRSIVHIKSATPSWRRIHGCSRG